MFSEGDPYGVKTRIEISDMSKKMNNIFSGLHGNKKYVVYSQHMDVIRRLLMAVDKPLYKNVAKSLDSIENLDKYLQEHEKELLDE
jgi:hypothetical protein